MGPMRSSAVDRSLRLLRAKLLFDLKDTAAVIRRDALCAYWSRVADTHRNFGDAINPAVIEYLTGERVVHSDDVFYFGWWPTIYCVGSILDNLSEGRAIIAGAGFKSPNAKIFRRPRKIIAVRGPLTKQKFEEMGVRCPEVFYDPGLLVSKIFPVVDATKSHDFGIIPHYIEKGRAHALPVISRDRSYRWIDIEAPPAQLAAAILSCRKIISSSLHGIIAAHSYGIPAAWMRISRMIDGGTFKFRDYYGSLGLTDPRAYVVTDRINLDAAEEFCIAYDVEGLTSDFLSAFRAQFPEE